MLGLSSNVFRKSGQEWRSVSVMFAPNGAAAVTDIFAPENTLVSVTRNSAGNYTLIFASGVAPSGATSLPKVGYSGTLPSNSRIVFVTPHLRNSSGTLANRASVASNVTYDSAGRMNVNVQILDGTGAAADAGPNVGIWFQVEVAWLES